MSSRRYFLLASLIIVLGVCAYAPMASIGFFGDDGIYQLVLRGELDYPTMQPPWFLFDFGTGADMRSDTELWRVHWWSSSDWTIRFLRPLASFSMWLDYTMWGDDPLPCHVVSLLWYGLALALVASLYRALGFERGPALLALALFAVTNRGFLPVGWLANRNTLMAIAFTAAAVIAVAQIRSRWRLPICLVLAALATGSKESGVVAFVLVGLYLALEAYRVENKSYRRRAIAGAVLFLSLGAAYVVGLAVAGYGTTSLYYATPWQQPIRYLGRLTVLFSAGPLSLLAPVSLDYVNAVPQTRFVLGATGLAVTTVLACFMVKRIRRHPAVPMLVGWLLFSLGVEGAALPSDRLLIGAAVGSAGLLALLVSVTLRRDPARPPVPRSHRFVAVAVLVISGIVTGVLLPVQSFLFAGLVSDLHDRVESTDVGPDHDSQIEAVVLQAGGETEAFVFGATWPIVTGRRDVRTSFVQLGRRGLEWTRNDDMSCTLRSLDQPFAHGFMEQVYRTDDDPQFKNSPLGNALFSVEPLAFDQQGLRTMRLHFTRSLDDPGLRFLVSSDQGLAPISPPPIGASTVIPTAPLAIPMLF
jgi:hypothetical protein